MMEHLQDNRMSGGRLYLRTSATRHNSNSNSVVGSTTGTGSGGTKCGRWNPTAEQVKVLTELFRAGLRTPSTDQIQKISSQLSSYGKIESKNVFYWFQNHKARDRQKRRRKAASVDQDDNNVEQLHAMFRKDNIISSSRFLQERNQGSDTERAIETLQLFPVNSFDKILQPEKPVVMEFSVIGHDYNKNASLTNKCADDMLGNYESRCKQHSPLDLRLSFM